MRPERLAILWAFALAGPGAAEPSFAPRPIAPHIYEGGWEHFVGGGLASFDCNGDAQPELYAAGGSAPAQLFLNRSGADLWFEPVASPLAIDRCDRGLSAGYRQ